MIFDSMFLLPAICLLVQGLSSNSLRADCSAGSIFSASTTARGWQSATPLRQWLERVLRSDMAGVLEVPRLGQGLLFIDDMHLTANDSAESANNDDKHFDRRTENQADALLKGILCGTPTFGIRRNLGVRDDSVATSGAIQLERQHGTPPVFHRLLVSDPTSRSPSQGPLSDGPASGLPSLAGAMGDYDNDYILQRVGFIGAASIEGEFCDIAKSCYQRRGATGEAIGGSSSTEKRKTPSLSMYLRLLPYFCPISMPCFNSTEIHVALIGGVCAMMQAEPSSAAKNLVDVLQSEITELCTITLRIVARFRKYTSGDVGLNTDVEDSLSRLVTLDVASVSKFCFPFLLSSKMITDPGGLIQAFAHEWRRNFLDLLPPGRGQRREKLLQFIAAELEALEAEKWSVSTEWLKALGLSAVGSVHGGSSIASGPSEELWTDVNVFRGLCTPVQGNITTTNEVDNHEDSLAEQQTASAVAALTLSEVVPQSTSVMQREDGNKKRSKSSSRSRSRSRSANRRAIERRRSSSRHVDAVATDEASDSDDDDDNGNDDNSGSGSVSAGSDDDGSESAGGSDSAQMESLIATGAALSGSGAIGEDERNASRLRQQSYAPLVSDLHFTYELSEDAILDGVSHDGQESRDPAVTRVRKGAYEDLHVSLSGLCSGDSCLTMLHPAALSMVTRIVRLLRFGVGGTESHNKGLTTRPQHILLSGFQSEGTSRPLAVALAVKLCGLHFSSFNVKRAIAQSDVAAVTSSASSRFESARWVAAQAKSFSLRSFLKAAVLRAAGFVEVDQSDEGGSTAATSAAAALKEPQPAGSTPAMTVVSNSVPGQQASTGVGQKNKSTGLVYTLTPPMSVVALIQGAQEIRSVSEKSYLLSVIENGDPTILFDNHEISAIAASLRDDATRSERAKQSSLDQLAEQHQSRMRAASGADDLEADGGSNTIIDADRRPNGGIDTGVSDDKFGGGKGAMIGTSRASNQFMALSDAPSGHVVQWVGGILRDTVRSRITIIVDFDIPQALCLKENLGKSKSSAVSSAEEDAGNVVDMLDFDDSNDDSNTAGAASGKVRVLNWKKESRGTAEESLLNQLVRRPPWKPIKHRPLSGGDNRISRGTTSGLTASSNLLACKLLGPTLARAFCFLYWTPGLINPGAVTKDVCSIAIATKLQELAKFAQRTLPYLAPDVKTAASDAHAAHAHVQGDSPALLFLPATVGMVQDPLETLLKREGNTSASAGARERREEAAARSEALKKLAERPENAEGVDSNTEQLDEAFRLVFDLDASLPSIRLFTGVLSQLGVVASQRELLLLESKISDGHSDLTSVLSSAVATRHNSTVMLGAPPVTECSARVLEIDESRRCKVSAALSSFLEEAQVVLPVVLSLPTDCDAVFLNEPVALGVQNGAEKGADLASGIAVQLIYEGGDALLHRFSLLSTVLEVADESLEVIQEYEGTKSTLAQNNEEIMAGIKVTTQAAAVLSAEIDGVRRAVLELYGWDRYQMTMEDSKSLHAGCAYVSHRLEGTDNFDFFSHVNMVLSHKTALTTTNTYFPCSVINRRFVSSQIEVRCCGAR